MSKHLPKLLDFIKQNQSISTKKKHTLLQAITDSDQELDRKNRELEIEAALECVRAEMMVMYKSDELRQVVGSVFTQLQILGFDAPACGMIIYNEDLSAEHWFAGMGQDTFPKSYKIPYVDNPYFTDLVDAWKEGVPFQEFPMEGKPKIAYAKWLITNSEFKHLPEAFKKEMLKPDKLMLSDAFMRYGMLEILGPEPLPEDKIIILKRFAKVFEQTYTRFLDLQKAEAQAREAEIELALERVRSRAMAMHKSEELLDVVPILFEGLNKLKIALTSGAAVAINIYLPDAEKMNVYVCGDSDLGLVIQNFVHPYSKNKVTEDLFNCRKQQMEVFVEKYSKTEKDNFYKDLFKNSELRDLPREVKTQILETNLLAMTVVPTEYFIINVVDLEGKVLSQDDVNILKRFSSVFSQAYTRFLDLQKAEAHNRELEIEAALEKVRSRSLAMHNSDELKEAATELYNQILNLGFEKVDSAGFVFPLPEENIQKCWFFETDTFLFSVFEIPYQGDLVLQERIEASNKGMPYLEQILTGKKLQNHMGIVMPESLRSLALEGAIEAMPSLTIFNMAFFKNGYINLISHDKLSKTEQSILIRFAKVFEQTYTRFLDLQKAEAQAREAQIEAALERVRARTMAMHKSEDLFVVIKTISEQLNLLNIRFSHVSFGFDTEDSDYNFWTSISGTADPIKITVPYIDHPITRGISEARKNKQTFLSDFFPAKIHETYIRHIIDHSELKLLPKKIKEDLVNRSIARSVALLPNIFLVLVNYKGIPYSDDDNSIIARFGQVFEQSYTRFLDLKKAEKQAKKAQIEAALERVRSRSMAMQHSTELNLVLTTVFEELVSLEIELERCVIWTYSEKDRSVRWWAANPEAESGTESFLITDQDHPVYHEYWKAWEERRSKYLYLLEGENKDSWTNILFTKTEMSRLPEEVKIGMMEPEKVYLYNTFHDFGVLFIVCTAPISDDKFSIIERFGNVFDQSYTRFKDIQKAESRAKEAIKQSSLDRVRAEIASMRTSNDLERITPLIWKELDTLGVSFYRCGVFIIDEKAGMLHAYLSVPTGESLAALHLDLGTNSLTKAAYKSWKKQTVYQEIWSQQQYIDFTTSMLKQGHIKDLKTFQQGKKAPEKLVLHLAPFKQGMLYVGNIETLSADHLELVKALADAFAIAYSRYEDFNQLEEAKKSVDNTLTELKSAQSQLIQSEKMASLGELTAGIAHEIQNPLNFVNNFSEVSEELLEELEEEIANNSVEDIKEILTDLKQNLNKINHHGQRASGIVKGMLDHSRTSKGERVLTDINVLADEYLRLAYHGLRAKDRTFTADFKTDLDESLPKISLVAQDFGRVILNLINNAFYAVSEKAKELKDTYQPTVIVTTKKMDEQIKISVKDNGNGIPKELVDKIFQPFFTTKPTGQGTGLGLSLSYDIVKAHGGELKVKSKEGEGSEFIIQLSNIDNSEK